MTENNKFLKQLRNKAMNLPLSSGVYIMKDKNGKVIYVGKAKALKNRVSTYFGSDKNHSQKVIQMVLNVVDFDYIVTDSEFEALVLENSLIKQNQPKYNILLKDDKGYSYIKISSEDYPRISEVKQVLDDGAKYIGPYMSSWSVKSSVDEARKVFKLPSCNKNFPRDFGKARPCLNFYIKQCCGLCTGKISKKIYNESVNDALAFIKGGSAVSIKSMTKEMEEAAENLEFEKAAHIRDRINAINRLNEKQKIYGTNTEWQDVIATAKGADKTVITVLKFKDGKLSDREDFDVESGQHINELLGEFIERYYEKREIPPKITIEDMPENADLIKEWFKGKSGRKVDIYVPQKGEPLKLIEMCKNNAAEKLSEKTHISGKEVSVLDELSKILGLKKPPQYIEAYDISNLAGGEQVGGMVVFKGTNPHKKAYRKFKIKTVGGQDDYASMREVIARRFNEYEKNKGEEGFGIMPDLILLDGGKGHVNAVEPLIRQMGYDVPVFGMVKDNKHKTRAIAVSGGEIAINSKRRAFTLISTIQEEVHRYAINYHRTLRKKSTFSSELLEIEGVGPSRAKELLKHFKTIKNIKLASVNDLNAVKGMNKKVAESIFDYYLNK